MNYLKIALKYHDAGFRVVPTGANKRPCNLLPRHGYGWAVYQKEQSKQDVYELFEPDSEGIAVLTGIDGLECIDIDNKYSLNGDMLQMFIDEVDSLRAGICIPDTVVVRTKSGGFHVLYRCDSPGRNVKLASRLPTETELEANKDEKALVLMETRGEGGYIIAYPTPGYEMYHGLMSQIPRIKMAHRDTLIRAARLFNEIEEQVQLTPNERAVIVSFEQNGKTTIGDFNERGDVPLMLSEHGWKFVKQRGENMQFKRPGNTDAATSAAYHVGMKVFKSFSTSTVFEANKGYSPFGVYAKLNHNNDFSAAAKALYEKGYGDRMTAASGTAIVKTPENALKTKDEFDDDWGEEAPVFDMEEDLRKRSFDIDSEPEQVPFTLRCEVDGKMYDVGGPGDIGLVEGMEKSRKSTFLKALISSALDDGRKRINFQFKLDGKKMICFDTEQGKRSFWRTHKQAHMMARRTEKPVFYEAYTLRDLTVAERIERIEHVISTRSDLAVVIIDGILDLTKNFNNEQQAQETAEMVMRWAEKSNAMIICVIHQTKANGYTIGHLGSMLGRKCSFAIEMVLDEDAGHTTVKAKRTRDTKKFPPFQFYQDEQGFPILNHNEAYVVRDGVAIPKNEDHFSSDSIFPIHSNGDSFGEGDKFDVF